MAESVSEDGAPEEMGHPTCELRKWKHGLRLNCREIYIFFLSQLNIVTQIGRQPVLRVPAPGAYTRALEDP